MRQPILTNHHRRPIPIPIPILPPHSNNLIPRPLRNPMIIPPKIEKQLRKRFLNIRHTPYIIGPFVGCDCLHFVGAEMPITR